MPSHICERTSGKYVTGALAHLNRYLHVADFAVSGRIRVVLTLEGELDRFQSLLRCCLTRLHATRYAQTGNDEAPVAAFSVVAYSMRSFIAVLRRSRTERP